MGDTLSNAGTYAQENPEVLAKLAATLAPALGAGRYQAPLTLLAGATEAGLQPGRAEAYSQAAQRAVELTSGGIKPGEGSEAGAFAKPLSDSEKAALKRGEPTDQGPTLVKTAATAGQQFQEEQARELARRKALPPLPEVGRALPQIAGQRPVTSPLGPQPVRYGNSIEDLARALAQNPMVRSYQTLGPPFEWTVRG